ncbi:hypothetical protein K4U03_00160 [Staphylococcus epidermidis]|nr:hypothetical protein [Staphylococcus epidermidis]
MNSVENKSLKSTFEVPFIDCALEPIRFKSLEKSLLFLLIITPQSNAIAITTLYTKGMVIMPEHIQQMLFDFALERGYIEKLLEMKEEDDK